MMRPIAIAALLLVFAAKLSQAQSQSRLEVFAGYSYARTPLSAQGLLLCPGLPTTCPILVNYSGTANASGFEASGAFRFKRHWSAVADAAGTFGSASQSGQLNAVSHDTEHQYTYLFGPQISWPRHISPFAQALFGAAHQSQSFTYLNFLDIAPTPQTSFSSQTSFAAAFGGGLDLNLTRHIGIRAIQFRELLTRFNSSTQYQPEISAGILFHLP
jgi:hypothetical protein